MRYLSIEIKSSTFRMDDAHADHGNAAFRTKRMEVIRRDDNTCQFCGLSIAPSRDENSGFLEVHHINGDHNDQSDDNLVTICPFCHSVHHIGFASMPVLPPPSMNPMGSRVMAREVAKSLPRGYLASMGHLTQASVIQLAHAQWYLKSTGDGREEDINKLFLDGRARLSASSPFLADMNAVANTLSSLIQKGEELSLNKFKEMLESVVFVPDIHCHVFGKAISHWTSNARGKIGIPEDKGKPLRGEREGLARNKPNEEDDPF